MIEIRRNVSYTQAAGCVLCLHVGGMAVYVGRGFKRCVRLELFTDRKRFRLSLL